MIGAMELLILEGLSKKRKKRRKETKKERRKSQKERIRKLGWPSINTWFAALSTIIVDAIRWWHGAVFCCPERNWYLHQ
jgi:hypothetical protein